MPRPCLPRNTVWAWSHRRPLTGTAFTFEGSIDGSTFRALYDEGTQYSVNVGTSRYVALKRQVMEPCKYLKVISGSSEAALRTITLVIGE
jgi:hypothetical protein